MRVFEHGNFRALDKCPICGTAEDKPVVLVEKAGTFNDGICEAIQVHLDCLELTIDGKTIYQIIRKDK